MAKRIKKEVISKGRKVQKKNLRKEGNKTLFLEKLWDHKKIVISLALVLLVIIVLSLFLFRNKDENVLNIENTKISTSEFMIYVYSAKYNYFGTDLTNVTDEDYEVIYDNESQTTVKDYLKEVALNDIKTAYAINKYAEKNNISLNDDDLKILKSEKEEYIKSLGGKKAYKKFLKDNNTTDSAYDKMAKTDMLYSKILTTLYDDGKVNDLTDEEKELAKKEYPSNYIKLEQIILTIVDIETGKSLNPTIINQKDALAKTIYTSAKDGENFEKLIKKYSESAIDNDGPYELYYKIGELLPEIENATLELLPGEVSAPIKTKYAYHIVKRLELDDSLLNDYYDDLREEKYLKDLTEVLNGLRIIQYKAYEKIEIS